MAIFSVPNVKISGVSACVPKKSISNHDYLKLSERERMMLIKTTGIEERRIAEEGVTTSDLCFVAAERLIQELKWNKEEIQMLIFVSQSRDYFLPATAIILQDRLGLPMTSIAFDISLGCSGYVYGLSVISSLMMNAKIGKALLMVGDISSFSLNENDKSTYPLFGDAGTVTALEYDLSAPPMHFNLQSDGSGYEAIIIPDGGLRNPLSEASYEEKEIDTGIKRSARNLSLNGLDVFDFSLREVAPNIQALFEYTGTTKDDYDYFVLHQANKLMNETIRKKMKIEPEKVPYTLKMYGNTSSASIPLTIVSELNSVVDGELSCIFSGFGVGLSWGSVALKTTNLVCPKLIEF